MATATITIYFDTGSSVTITEQSVLPISDNVQGAALIQAAFQKTLAALGLSIQAPTTEGTEDGDSGRGAGARPGRDGADVPGGPERNEGRKR